MRKVILKVFFMVTFFAVVFGTDSIFAEEVTFAMLPQAANAILFKKWRPLLAYLEKETGLKFTQIFPKNFDEHIKLCREGKIDFAYSNPITYIKMAPHKGVREEGHIAIAIANTPNGPRDFYGLFIIRSDNSEIKRFEDIKGKKGWIVSWISAAGYVFQQAYALDHGINLKEDCRLFVSPGNKQEKVIMAVYNREADFGCIRNGMLEVMKGRIDLSQIKVLAETPRYPSWVFSVHTKVNPKIVEKVRRALLNMPKELLEKAKLPGEVTGFVRATDADFESIREVAEKVGVEY